MDSAFSLRAKWIRVQGFHLLIIQTLTGSAIDTVRVDESIGPYRSYTGVTNQQGPLKGSLSNNPVQ